MNHSSLAAHVVILAAGRGSRLGALGQQTPKWLLGVGPRTLADRHLEGLAKAQDQVAGVIVVTGHAGTAIDDYLGRRRTGDAETVDNPDAGTLHNPDYARRNNWYSVLLALRAVPEDARVVLVNADLLTHPDVTAAFVREAATTSAEGLLAVDLARELTDESMKVSLRPDGTLERIGKVGVDDAVGEYVGMLMVRGSVLSAFRGALEAFEGRSEHDDEWYEGAVGRTAAEGAAWHVWGMPDGQWVEIDDDRDFATASELVGSWNERR